MRAVCIFAAVSLAVIVAGAWLLGLAYDTPADGRAIRTSAGIAYVIQLFTFAIARAAPRENVIAAWGIGALLRFVALVVYALAVVNALGLPLSAALVSLAIFFFVSTLVEPVLLKS